MAKGSLRTRLQAVEARIPVPMERVVIVRRTVAPNPEWGGPPIDLGIAERTTTSIPTEGYPAVVERWEPETLDDPPLLTEADAVRFFELTGTCWRKNPSAAALHDKGRGLFIWRNAPGGAALAKHGDDLPIALQPLWPCGEST